ncbi:MAG: hypothetical protein LC623_05470 [Halobacteriales archaeon]|nr:hypothetical protein [Halobacteriales archaeon]
MTLATLGTTPLLDDDLMRHLVKTEDIGTLVQGLFGYDLSPGQERIASTVAFPRGRERVTVLAPTRYGKTRSFSLGLATRFLVDPKPLVVEAIGPLEEQAQILRGYMAHAIIRQPLLGAMVDSRGGSTVEALKKEVSHKRITFTDGKQFTVRTAQGDADRLMGSGGDIIAKDEACLISPEADAKIARMLGDSPEAELYELANPWHRENAFFKHTQDPSFTNIHIPIEQALAEGRIDPRHLADMRRDMAPTMYQVLYLSQFPDIAEDQLIPWGWIQRAVRATPPGKPRWSPPAGQGWRRQAGADIAEGGLDKTVVARGWRRFEEKRLVVLSWRSWQIADTMETATRIDAELEADETVAVDENGVGKGVADYLRRMGRTVFGFKGGRKARNPERFFNATSEALWLLRRGMEEDLVELHDPPQAVMTDLTKWRWKVVGGRIKVEVEGGKEGGNSPDHGDALAMMNYSEAGGERGRRIQGRDPLGMR